MKKNKYTKEEFAYVDIEIIANLFNSTFYKYYKNKPRKSYSGEQFIYS